MGMEIIPIPWLRPAQSQTALGGTNSFLETCWFQLPTSFSFFLGLSAGPGEPGPVTPTGGLRLQVVTPAEQWGEVWPPSPCGGCSGRGGGSQPVRAAYTEGRHGGQAQGKWTTQESGQVCELEGSMSPGPSTTPISMAVSSCGACGLEATLSGTRQGWGERPCSTGAWSKGFQVAGPRGPLPLAPPGAPPSRSPTVQRPRSQLLPWTGPGYRSPTVSGKEQRAPEPSPQQPHRSGLDHRRQSGPGAGDRGTDWVVWRSLWLPQEGSEVRLPGLSSWVPSPLPSVGFNLCLVSVVGITIARASLVTRDYAYHLWRALPGRVPE